MGISLLVAQRSVHTHTHTCDFWPARCKWQNETFQTPAHEQDVQLEPPTPVPSSEKRKHRQDQAKKKMFLEGIADVRMLHKTSTHCNGGLSNRISHSNCREGALCLPKWAASVQRRHWISHSRITWKEPFTHEAKPSNTYLLLAIVCWHVEHIPLLYSYGEQKERGKQP